MKKRILFYTMTMIVGVSLTGCGRSVPESIVKKAMEDSIRTAPNTTSAMCGVDVDGLTVTETSIKKTGDKNTGIVHVKGKPRPSFGHKKLKDEEEKDPPKECEGDIEYQFSYTSKRFGRRTEVTWSLDKMKLVAVQTKGVKFKPVEEKPHEDEADEEKDTKKKGDKSSKKKDGE